MPLLPFNKFLLETKDYQDVLYGFLVQFKGQPHCVIKLALTINVRRYMDYMSENELVRIVYKDDITVEYTSGNKWEEFVQKYEEQYGNN